MGFGHSKNGRGSGGADLAADIRLAVLAQSSRGGRLLLWAIILFVVAALSWAARAEIEEVTRGQGRVIPSRQIQVVQNLEGGIVREILVSEGQVVEEGQLLIRIDATTFSGSVRENRARLMGLRARLARLRAEADGTEIELPEEVVKAVPEIARRERELFHSRKRELAARIEILREKVSQRAQALAEMRARARQLRETFNFLRQEIALTGPLVSQGAASEVELLRLRRQASELEGELTSTELAMPRVESTRKEAEKEIQEAGLEFRNRAKLEMNDVLAQVETMSVSSITLEDRLSRTLVRSPVRGTVNRVLVNTIGGVITPGMDLVEIVPLEDSLLVEARIRPSDIGFLRPEQEATVKFSAYDFTIYGGLPARVEYLSADSITNEEGGRFYVARVRTDRNFLGSAKDPMPIIPGMVATVDIVTGRKTILSYILKPVLRARETALRER